MITALENKLNTLLSVILPESGICKFIVVPVTDGISSKYVLVGSNLYKYHTGIFLWYRKQLPATLNAEEPVGGGKINLTEGGLYAYGCSVSYGEAPQKLVEELLRPYVEERKLTLSIKMGDDDW